MNPDSANAPPSPSYSQEHHPDIDNPIAHMMPDERNICQISRHPIGMLGIYIMAGGLLIVVAILAIIVAPHFITSTSSSKVTGIGLLIFLLVAIVVGAFVFVSNKVYWGNRWILSSDSLTQVVQSSLLDKQSSQLSLGNLEDVTAEKNGLLPHMFNFGVLRVETAGERSKFVFNYCPNPNFYAQQILGAREAFEQKIRQVGGVNQGNYVPPQINPQPTYGGPPPADPTGQDNTAQPPAYTPPPASPEQPPYYPPNPVDPDGGVNPSA